MWTSDLFNLFREYSLYAPTVSYQHQHNECTLSEQFLQDNEYLKVCFPTLFFPISIFWRGEDFAISAFTHFFQCIKYFKAPLSSFHTNEYLTYFALRNLFPVSSCGNNSFWELFLPFLAPVIYFLIASLGQDAATSVPTFTMCITLTFFKKLYGKLLFFCWKGKSR